MEDSGMILLLLGEFVETEIALREEKRMNS